jgi:hydrogenase maturation factor HypF (carbamoyltransferase family)
VTTLKSEGFNVFWHSIVPTNDGGVSYGQAVIASYRSKIRTK